MNFILTVVGIVVFGWLSLQLLKSEEIRELEGKKISEYTLDDFGKGFYAIVIMFVTFYLLVSLF